MPSLSAIHRLNQRSRNPVGRKMEDHPSFVILGRAGWFAKGVVYFIAGVLALSVAAKASGWAASSPTTGDEEASPTGAINTIADSAGGGLLLWLLAIGMLLYAAWRVVSALLPGGTDMKAWLRRGGYVVSAIMYATFAVSAISLAIHSTESEDGNETVTDLSASIMSNGFGRIVIGVAGLVVIAVGVYRISKGVTMDVTDELDLSGMSPTRVRWTERLGAVGEVGRGIGIALVGFFIVSSAVSYDPDEATGLDGALRRLAVEAWGVVVVVVVGVGFAAYGLFCLATFTHRQLEAP